MLEVLGILIRFLKTISVLNEVFIRELISLIFTRYSGAVLTTILVDSPNDVEDSVTFPIISLS